jgi:hypothetical protein
MSIFILFDVQITKFNMFKYYGNLYGLTIIILLLVKIIHLFFSIISRVPILYLIPSFES